MPQSKPVCLSCINRHGLAAFIEVVRHIQAACCLCHQSAMVALVWLRGGARA